MGQTHRAQRAFETQVKPPETGTSVLMVQIQISYSLRLIINEHVLAANLICVHCLGGW